MVLEVKGDVWSMFLHYQLLLEVDYRGKNYISYEVFVDLQKAFDWVDRDLLFYKIL